MKNLPKTVKNDKINFLENFKLKDFIRKFKNSDEEIIAYKLNSDLYKNKHWLFIEKLEDNNLLIELHERNDEGDTLIDTFTLVEKFKKLPNLDLDSEERFDINLKDFLSIKYEFEKLGFVNVDGFVLIENARNFFSRSNILYEKEMSDKRITEELAFKYKGFDNLVKFTDRGYRTGYVILDDELSKVSDKVLEENIEAHGGLNYFERVDNNIHKNKIVGMDFGHSFDGVSKDTVLKYFDRDEESLNYSLLIDGNSIHKDLEYVVNSLKETVDSLISFKEKLKENEEELER